MNPYRFTQLGVGWVLRDVSVHHLQAVIDFLNKHEKEFSKEAARYATEKMKPSQKKQVTMFQKLFVCYDSLKPSGIVSGDSSVNGVELWILTVLPSGSTSQYTSEDISVTIRY